MTELTPEQLDALDRKLARPNWHRLLHLDEQRALVAAAREGNEWKRDTTVLATENRKLRARLARIDEVARDAARRLREPHIGLNTVARMLEAALEETP